MTAKDIAKDVRTWIGTIGVLIGASVVIARYVELPDKVQKVEAVVDVHDDSIKEVSTTLSTFIAQQTIQQRDDHQIKKMLTEVLSKPR